MYKARPAMAGSMAITGIIFLLIGVLGLMFGGGSHYIFFIILGGCLLFFGWILGTSGVSKTEEEFFTYALKDLGEHVIYGMCIIGCIAGLMGLVLLIKGSIEFAIPMLVIGGISLVAILYLEGYIYLPSSAKSFSGGKCSVCGKQTDRLHARGTCWDCSPQKKGAIHYYYLRLRTRR